MRFNPGRPRAARSFRAPVEFVDKHAAGFHVLIPGVVNEVVETVWSFGDGVVAGSYHMVRHGAQDARTVFITRIGISPKDIIRYRVIHSIRVIFPATAAVKAKIL